MQLKPKRPYIFNAYYLWLVDNELTPYILVNAEYPETLVPANYLNDGKIVMNISSSAVGSFATTETHLKFSGRFNGIIENISIPFGALLALYARENGEGIQFEPEIYYQKEYMSGKIKQEYVQDHKDKIITDKKAKKSPLKIIK